MSMMSCAPFPRVQHQLWRRNPERAACALNVICPVMSERRPLFPPPPSHPSRSRNISLNVSPTDLLHRVPPPPPPARPSPRPSTGPPSPGPVEPPPGHLPGGVEDLDAASVDDDQSFSEPPTIREEELTEAQLREVYDEEEINRFLYLFSTVRYTTTILICPSFV